MNLFVSQYGSTYRGDTLKGYCKHSEMEYITPVVPLWIVYYLVTNSEQEWLIVRK